MLKYTAEFYIWHYRRDEKKWRMIRPATPTTGRAWLDLYREDEPEENFKLAKSKPLRAPALK